MTDDGSVDNRDRGVLSPADRAYLQSDPESYSRQAQHAREAAIRTRLRNGIKDFTLILEHHDKFDVASVVEGDPEERAEIRRGLIAMVAFLYGVARDFRPPSKQLIEMGVETGSKKWFDQPVEAELDIDPQEVVNIPQVCEVVESGDLDTLTDRERQWILDLVAEGAELTAESLLETYRQTPEGKLMARHAEKALDAADGEDAEGNDDSS